MEKEEKRLFYNRFFSIIMIIIVILSILTNIIAFYKIVILENKIKVLSYDFQAQVEQQETIESSKIETSKAKKTKNNKGDSSSILSDAKDYEEVKRVYLTFDDGPSTNTDEILDILKEYQVKATFFVVGKEDECSRKQYARIVDEGHTLGMHSYSHQYETIYSSLDAYEEDIEKLSQLLYECTGVHTKFYRFPGGSSNSVSKVHVEDCIKYLEEHEIKYYDWNALNGDAVTKGLSPETLIQNIMKDVKKYNTSVVLMHDLANRHTTVESLPALITTLRKQGYELLPITEDTPLVQHIKAETVLKESSKQEE